MSSLLSIRYSRAAPRRPVLTFHSVPTHCKVAAKLTDFSRQLAIQQVPDLVSGLFLDINEAVDKLGSVLNNATNSLGCPNLNNISKSEFNDYPGFAKE
jgi:hypothetical protein